MLVRPDRNFDSRSRRPALADTFSSPGAEKTAVSLTAPADGESKIALAAATAVEAWTVAFVVVAGRETTGEVTASVAEEKT